MARTFDSIVLGGNADALVAALTLAQGGSRVLLLDEHTEPGGTSREIEFAPGYRAAPLAADAGYISPQVARLAGLSLAARPASDPAVISLADGVPLPLHSSLSRTAEALARFSERDAREWPHFAQRMHVLTRFLEALYAAPPPRIDAESLDEWLGLAGAGRRFRSLGTSGMVDLLRTLPMSVADLLDDTFESERLKGTLAALGVMDVCQGPLSGGTAFTLLHRHLGAEPGIFSERVRLPRGASSLIAALAKSAQASGVTLQTGVSLQSLEIRDGRVTGITLASGETINSERVISALNPWRSLLELVDPIHLAPEFIEAVRHIRFRGVTTKILVALEALPEVPGMTAAPSGAVLIAPGIRYVERAYDAAKYGRCSDEPVIEVRFPGVATPGNAPEGRHVAVIHVQYTPWRLRDHEWPDVAGQVADRALACVEREMPGFTSRIRHRLVLTPRELELQFGLPEGAVSEGEMMLDQILFMRPVPGCARYATPIAGYFLCGPGTHPGPGITGVSGHLAARAALRARVRGRGVQTVHPGFTERHRLLR